MIGAVLAGVTGLVGLISGTVFGLYNTNRISRLESAFNRQEDRRREMLHVTERLVAQQSQINNNQKKMTAIIDNLQGLLEVSDAKIQTLLLYQRLDYAVYKTKEYLQHYSNIITQATNHRLAKEVVSFGEASTALLALQELAKEKNLQLAINLPNHLQQCETSLIFKEHGARLYIHIPAIVEDLKFELYFLKAFPLPSPAGLFLYVKPPKPFLAINRFKQRHNQPAFVELNEDELSNCMDTNGQYFCHEITQIHYDSDISCSMSLYNSNHNKSLKVCPVEVEPAAELALPIGNNKFMLYSKDKTTVALNCPGKPILREQLPRTDIIEIPVGCWLDLPMSTIFASKEVEYSHQPTAYFIGETFDKYLPMIDPITAKNLLTRINEITPLTRDPNLLAMLARLEETDETYQGGFLGTALWLCLLSAFDGLLIIIFTVNHVRKSRQATRQRNDIWDNQAQRIRNYFNQLPHPSVDDTNEGQEMANIIVELLTNRDRRAN